jgi:hypothetical protein
VSASTWAPPVTSSSLPIMAPSPTRSATLARVVPKPSRRVLTASPTGIPAPSAVSRLTRISAANACSRSTMISTSGSAMAPSAMSSNGPVSVRGYHFLHGEPPPTAVLDPRRWWRR